MKRLPVSLIFVLGVLSTNAHPVYASQQLADTVIYNRASADNLLEKLLRIDPWDVRADASSLAWGEAATLNAIMDMFEATGDRKYLEILSARGKQVLSHRDDKRGVADMSGNVRPGWSMGFKYVVAAGSFKNKQGDTVLDIRTTPYASGMLTTVELIPQGGEGKFTVKVENSHYKREELFTDLSLTRTNGRFVENVINDPMAPYNATPGSFTDKSNLIRVKLRKDSFLPAQKIRLEPLPLAYIGYLGIIYQPLIRFAEVVRNDKRFSDLVASANYFIRSAEESYADANKRLWRNGPGTDEGYYLTCEKGESFPADNVGQPFNFLGKHVCVLLALYRLTNKAEYRILSEKMCRLFKNRLKHDAAKDLYTWFYWYEPMTTVGWRPEDNLSQNVRYFKPAPNIEDISHGTLDIAMVAEAYKQRLVFDEIDLKRFSNTLLKNILMPDGSGVRRKVDGYGVAYEPYFPILFGWLELAGANDEVYLKIRQLYQQKKQESFLFTARLLKWEKLLSPKQKN